MSRKVIAWVLALLATCQLGPSAFGGPVSSGRGKALIVVGIQEDCTGRILKRPFLYQKGSDGFISRVNDLTAKAIERDVLVIYLRTNMKRQDVPGARLDVRLKQRTFNCFLKDALDAFSSTDHAFSDFLKSRKDVTDLFLLGLDATLCVRETARAAAKQGYRATVLTDLVETISGKTREELERMYASDGVRVTTSVKFVRSLERALSQAKDEILHGGERFGGKRLRQLPVL